MTREEAIHILDNLKPTNTKSSFDAYVVGKAITMAIKALEQEPCVDCISRQQAIDKMQELEDDDVELFGCSIPEGFDGKRAIEALKTLPSI